MFIIADHYQKNFSQSALLICGHSRGDIRTTFSLRHSMVSSYEMPSEILKQVNQTQQGRNYCHSDLAIDTAAMQADGGHQYSTDVRVVSLRAQLQDIDSCEP